MEKYLELTKSLISEFDKSSSNFFEIHISDYSLTLEKGTVGLDAAAANPSSGAFAGQSGIFSDEQTQRNEVPVNRTAGASADITAGSAENKSEGNASASELQEIKSPIVGVFYESKDPDSAPFVKEGQQIKKGDVLCILESMKMMNEIRSDYDGVVKEIKCKNEELVDFGQVLFVLEKN